MSFLSFLGHKNNFTHCPAVTETARFPNPAHCNKSVHFLSLSLWFSFFFPSSSLHNSAYNRGIHFLLWFSFFFLYTIQLVIEIYAFFSDFLFSLNAGSILSILLSLRLQLGILEQEYFLYFWVELDKFHHYQMRLIFPFKNYQRFGFRSCLFKLKITTDSRVNL
ncbi:unnamed protein product [Acanthosepion pharaonis]|uniref:Uncharacterized protein n=1 Tax=Acanthosepion pharaonis TaxID=158019 RepID=A0A812DYR3_ACAPH|nr:unnamed protein product [Sepia pharaonis]